MENDLLLDRHFRSEGEVSLVGATIGGNFDCEGGQFINTDDDAITADGAKIAHDFIMRNDFKSEGGVRLVGATIGENLDCADGHFSNATGDAISADGAIVNGDVLLRKSSKTNATLADAFKAEGTVEFIGATIAGNLDCSDGQFINRGTNALVADGLEIRGDVLLNDNFKAEGTVTVISAAIGGNLYCQGGRFVNSNAIALNFDATKIERGVYLSDGFKAEGQVSLISATVRGSLVCTDGQFINYRTNALTAYRLEVNGNVYLDHEFKAEGEVSLAGGTIGGNLYCQGGHFVNRNAIALDAGTIKIGGGVFLNNGFKAEGEVDLNSATIAVNLNCTDAQFINFGANALVADGVEIKGNANFNGKFDAEGKVSLISAAISGDLDCSGGKFINPGTNTSAFLAERVRVDGDVFLRNNFEANGRVTFAHSYIARNFEWHDVKSPGESILDLRSAKIGTLEDDKASWPKVNNLYLDGFNYDELRNLADTDSRLDWLRRQPTNQFLPQTYEQLAGLFRKMGKEDEAVAVIIAKNEDFAKHLPWYSPSRLWYNFFGEIIGFGYKTWQAIIPSLFFIVLGTVLFRFGQRHYLVLPSDEKAYTFDSNDKLHMKEKDYPVFNSFIYSLEVFVPLVKLGMDEFWRPAANRRTHIKFRNKTKTITGSALRWYWWLHIVAGWILTTLWVGGLTGLIKT